MKYVLLNRTAFCKLLISTEFCKGVLLGTGNSYLSELAKVGFRFKKIKFEDICILGMVSKNWSFCTKIGGFAPLVIFAPISRVETAEDALEIRAIFRN